MSQLPHQPDNQSSPNGSPSSDARPGQSPRRTNRSKKSAAGSSLSGTLRPPFRIRSSRAGRILLYAGLILFILLTSGYFIIRGLIRKKLDAAIHALPPSWQVTYASADPALLSGSIVIDDLHIRYEPTAGAPSDKDIRPDKDSQHKYIDAGVHRMGIHGIHFLALLFSHRLQIGSIRLEGCRAELDDRLLDKDLPPIDKPEFKIPFTEILLDKLELIDARATMSSKNSERFFFEGSGEIDSIATSSLQRSPHDNPTFGGFRLRATQLRYTIPGAFQRIKLSGLEISSAAASLHIDTVRISPTVDKMELGRLKGFQEDVVEAVSQGIQVDQLDTRALIRRRLVAGRITVLRNNIHVFRDRRLPRKEDVKPLPMDYLRSLPISIRVQSVKIGATSFAYEEFPEKGDQTGTLKIVRLNGSLSPLISRPEAGDPAYSTLVMQGSLMGSGSVTATTKLPLQRGEPYKVEGAFHELDVTTLNPSAENLGRIHLESGILNTLSFQFDMTDEKSTGRVVGEYHDLVVQKLRGNSDDKKVDRVKSFFLKKFIIPRNKDHTLSETKRTGKVSYKHDPTRNFSYYLLHSLLVGVKSSFSLGFLLPG